MSEWLMIGLMLSAVAGWTIGGTVWKGARRFVWPAIAGVVLLMSGVVWWRAFGAMLTLGAVNTLGYGDKTPWSRRLLVYASYAVPLLWLDVQVALIAAPLMAIGLGTLKVLSERFNRITWKIWEATAGLAQAAGLIIATLR